jgi:hypothetical protein
MATPEGARRWWWLWGAVYVVLLAAVVWAMFATRHWAETELTKPAMTADWEAWRDDVRAQQDKPVLVKRRVPKSAEPPALVLTRDYFGVMFFGAVFFSSLLYWITAWLVTGMLSQRADTS